VKKVLLKDTKIGEFLSIGAEVEGDEVGIFIASTDVSASCAFKFDEWEKFVAGINKADEIFKKRFKRL
jgi:glutathionylspermidine synthase